MGQCSAVREVGRQAGGREGGRGRVGRRERVGGRGREW